MDYEYEHSQASTFPVFPIIMMIVIIVVIMYFILFKPAQTNEDDVSGSTGSNDSAQPIAPAAPAAASVQPSSIRPAASVVAPAAASVQPSTIPVGQPLHIPDYWVLSSQGESCQTACTKLNRTCNITKIKDLINSVEKTKNAASSAGRECNNVAAWGYSSGPGICTDPGCCAPDSNCVGICANGYHADVSCSTTNPAYSRICACDEITAAG
jgi:hypothetical protein